MTARSIPKKVYRFLSAAAVLLIVVYQRVISPMLPTKCRYTPTCSTYTIEAIHEWGLLYGILLGIKRISRCHPCGGWGYDPAPKKQKHSQQKNIPPNMNINND
ncbi:MAG: membrane protein insertion efficiency factor YidD [Chitinispirillaceae bacterium]|nr:membrane protein insertion efficiency factor YidD [Chitinispirillaceae bacterium]